MSFFSKKLPSEVSNFLKYAPKFSMSPEDLGRTFENQGETYTIVGSCFPGCRFPIMARDSAGRTTRFSTKDIITRLYDPTARA